MGRKREGGGGGEKREKLVVRAENEDNGLRCPPLAVIPVVRGIRDESDRARGSNGEICLFCFINLEFNFNIICARNVIIYIFPINPNR